MRDRLTYALLLLLAVEAAVWECFLVPAHPHGAAAGIALVANLGLGSAAARTRPGGAIGTGVCWLIVALGLSLGGPLGDVIVPGQWWGVLFLVAGVAGAVAPVGVRRTNRASSATPAAQTGR